jgi:hypothetical protein
MAFKISRSDFGAWNGGGPAYRFRKIPGWLSGAAFIDLGGPVCYDLPFFFEPLGSAHGLFDFRVGWFLGGNPTIGAKAEKKLI